MLLSRKVVLVTGASKGRALAVGLASEDALVAINFKTDPAGAEATRRLG